MNIEKRGFNFIYLPSRGNSKSFFISSIWVFLALVVFLVFLFASFRLVHRYNYYKTEFVKIAGLSLEETEQLQQEELDSIEKELKVIYEIQEKNLEKMKHIANSDSKNRTNLKLASINLNPDDYLSDITRYTGYFNNLTTMNLQTALTIEKDLIDQKEKLDQIITNNEILSLASEEFLLQWEKTPLGFPLKGPIDPGYGYRIHPVWGTPDWHTGVDISGYYGQDVVATAAGRVIKSTLMGGYGNTVIVYHRDGISTLYAHNSKNLVHEGEYVKRGQVIAKAGSTGTATCVHVHYEVRYGAETVDPERFNSLVNKHVPR
ncbi:MAG: M23 family metallopeptidase [Caldisericia bacterium]|nr:M23 family metallopeptidase [Caldisericia bacterium]MDD4614016.1 M23 family metallopeptidase [Caldisericia bacterium]